MLVLCLQERAETGQGEGSFYFLFCIVSCVVGILYQDVHYDYDKNIQFLNKRTKAPQVHCAASFWKHFPFRSMSFDPCRLVRLTDQVEFSHFEVTERTSDSDHRQNQDRMLWFQLQCKAWKTAFSRSHGKATTMCHVFYGCPMSPRADNWHFQDST